MPSFCLFGVSYPRPHSFSSLVFQTLAPELSRPPLLRAALPWLCVLGAGRRRFPASAVGLGSPLLVYSLWIGAFCFLIALTDCGSLACSSLSPSRPIRSSILYLPPFFSLFEFIFPPPTFELEDVFLSVPFTDYPPSMTLTKSNARTPDSLLNCFLLFQSYFRFCRSLAGWGKVGCDNGHREHGREVACFEPTLDW